MRAELRLNNEKSMRCLHQQTFIEPEVPNFKYFFENSGNKGNIKKIKSYRGGRIQSAFQWNVRTWACFLVQREATMKVRYSRYFSLKTQKTRPKRQWIRAGFRGRSYYCKDIRDTSSLGTGGKNTRTELESQFEGKNICRWEKSDHMGSTFSRIRKWGHQIWESLN